MLVVRPFRHGPAFGALVAISLLLTARAPALAQDIMPAPTHWPIAAARDLLRAIDGAKQEGLNPADYDPDALRRAIDGGEGPALDGVAETAGMAIARDYFLGRVRDQTAFDWHIERSPYEAQALNDGLRKAAADGNVGGWLEGLLPSDPQYRALRDALRDASDPAEALRVRANMERWRWLPRTLGEDYLLVVVPSYTLRVMRGGVEVARHDVIVGKPKTPTPSLVAQAEQVVVNPWWTLPPSVLAEGGGFPASKGYVRTRGASGGLMIRQRPGPSNALGRLKIDMPNPDAIYLHDTPAKALFDRKDRALSHGCIRVRDIDELVTGLGDDGAIDMALAGTDTVNVPITRPLPVYIVYLTAEADNGRVTRLPDIYGRDERLIAMLDGKPFPSPQATKRAAIAPARGTTGIPVPSTRSN